MQAMRCMMHAGVWAWVSHVVSYSNMYSKVPCLSYTLYHIQTCILRYHAYRPRCTVGRYVLVWSYRVCNSPWLALFHVPFIIFTMG